MGAPYVGPSARARLSRALEEVKEVGDVGFVIPVRFSASAFFATKRSGAGAPAEDATETRPGGVSSLQLHAGTQFDAASPPPLPSWAASGWALHAEPRVVPTVPSGATAAADAAAGSRLMDEDWDQPFTIDPRSPPAEVPEAVFSLDDPSTPTASDAPTPGRRRMQSSATRTTPSLFERAGIKKDEHGERSVFRFKQTKGRRVSFGRPSVLRTSIMMNDLEQGEIVEDEADAASTSEVDDDREGKRRWDSGPASSSFASLLDALSPSSSGPQGVLSPEGRRRQRQQQQQREQERRETGRDEPGGSERGRAGQTLNRQKEPVRHDMLDYAKHMGVPKMDLETDPAVHITEFMWVWAGMLFLLGGVLVFMIVWIARLLSDS